MGLLSVRHYNCLGCEGDVRRKKTGWKGLVICLQFVQVYLEPEEPPDKRQIRRSRLLQTHMSLLGQSNKKSHVFRSSDKRSIPGSLFQGTSTKLILGGVAIVGV